MQKEQSNIVIKRIPITFMLTILLQTCGIVWWASANERNDVFQDMRLEHLETDFERVSYGTGKIVERLARIEERSEAQMQALSRIEKKLQ